MRRTRRPGLSFDAAQHAFQSAAITVSGLYIATNSVAATMIGTTAATVMAVCTAWLFRNQLESPVRHSRQPSSLRRPPKTTKALHGPAGGHTPGTEDPATSAFTAGTPPKGSTTATVKAKPAVPSLTIRRLRVRAKRRNGPSAPATHEI